jgi:hypothetical protein
VPSEATYATIFVAYWLVSNRKDEPTKENVQNRKVEKKTSTVKSFPKKEQRRKPFMESRSQGRVRCLDFLNGG